MEKKLIKNRYAEYFLCTGSNPEYRWHNRYGLYQIDSKGSNIVSYEFAIRYIEDGDLTEGFKIRPNKVFKYKTYTYETLESTIEDALYESLYIGYNYADKSFRYSWQRQVHEGVPLLDDEYLNSDPDPFVIEIKESQADSLLKAWGYTDFIYNNYNPTEKLIHNVDTINEVMELKERWQN